MLVNLVISWLYFLMVTTRVISPGDLYCCLLPQCEALRTCRSGFRSQQNGAVTGISRLCQVQTSQKECAIGPVRCKKEWMILQTFRRSCIECAIHHERLHGRTMNRMCAKNNTHIWHEQAIIDWICGAWSHCCLMPECEASRTCHSGFAIVRLHSIAFFFFFWAISSIHCLAARDFGAGIEQPFGCLIVQNVQAM